jgi:hypothetical protein
MWIVGLLGLNQHNKAIQRLRGAGRIHFRGQRFEIELLYDCNILHLSNLVELTCTHRSDFIKIRFLGHLRQDANVLIRFES